MHVLRRIERYLRRTNTPATRFGREAVRDPRLVLDLRNGRELRSHTAARISAYLDACEKGEARP
jgi:2,4-dienoyl-CoA reductase-like NADH-dependent reductase (Old Yellow Enzyme family)